jgi:hypothetical protein
MARTTGTTKTVITQRHDQAKRNNIPTAECQSALPKNAQDPVRVASQMARFERLCRRVDDSLTDARFQQIIVSHATVFRTATPKGAVPGLAKLVP